MHWLALYFGGILIGIGRGVTEAVKFNYKNGEFVPEYVNTHGKYHGFSLLMWLGILLVCCSAYVMGTIGRVFDIFVCTIVVFWAYYYPYVKVYMYTRGRGWSGKWYYSHYVFELFGKEFRIPYVSCEAAVFANISTLLYCVVRSFL